jgi:hypothetical protein
MAYTLQYQIPNYTVSQDGGINTKLSNTPTAPCHTTWRPCTSRQATWRFAVKADAAPISEKPTVHTYIFITKLQGVTTGNMAIARNTILTYYTKTSNTRPHDEPTTWPTHSNTRLHSATIVTFTGLYLHLRLSLLSKDSNSHL